MDQADKLKGIYYISIPASMQRSIGGFQIKSDIKLPVELPKGADSLVLSELSWEMVMAGMLKILAWEPEHVDTGYFREFLNVFKPELADELLAAAILKARDGDYELAEEMFLAVEGLKPDLIAATVNRAIMYESQAVAAEKLDDRSRAEEYDEKAFTLYKLVLSSEDVDPEAYYNAAFFFTRNRNFPKARECLERFLEFEDDPGLEAFEDRFESARLILTELKAKSHLDSLFKESYDAILLGREEEGIGKARDFLALYPDTWNAWFMIGWANRRLGKWVEGRDAFLKALELGGKDVDLLNELSICLMELGELATARARLIEALRIEPENPKIISNLGVVALKAGRREEARGFFLSVLEIEPSDPLSKRYLEELNT